jgi:hypothetical protein
MRTSLIHKRLESLAVKFHPRAIREFTLEELCRQYWQLDKKAFQALAKECTSFQFFVSMFQREDADNLIRAGRRAGAR